MSDRFDYIAVGPRGVYGICSDIPGDPEVQRFIAKALKRGHHVERVPVAEAVERYKSYLAQLPEFAQLSTPSHNTEQGRTRA